MNLFVNKISQKFSILWLDLVLLEEREGVERKEPGKITITLTWHPPRKNQHAFMQETIYIYIYI
jgi:hypothetical protein